MVIYVEEYHYKNSMILFKKFQIKNKTYFLFVLKIVTFNFNFKYFSIRFNFQPFSILFQIDLKVDFDLKLIHVAKDYHFLLFIYLFIYSFIYLFIYLFSQQIQIAKLIHLN